MRNILITGGCGFIGGHLVKRLLREKRNCKISVIDNKLLDQKKNDNSYEKYNNRVVNRHDTKFVFKDNGNQVFFYKVDIRNKASILKIFDSQRIDTCIHLAAKISVDDSLINPDDTIDTNIKGTLNMLEACSSNNVKNFVFASSAAVYGKPKCLPIAEDYVAIDVLSPYGASKIAAEALVSSYGNLKKIQRAISLRFFNVYGENQSDEYAGVITKFAIRLSRGLPPIIYGDGKQTRDFIFIDDVVDAIVRSAEPSEDIILSSNTFNVGTGIPTRIDDLARRMIRIFGLQLQPIYRKGKKGDVIDSYADMTKSNMILKFTPHKGFEEGLREIVKSYSVK
jgi:UDP-glucose 4-epimerase